MKLIFEIAYITQCICLIVFWYIWLFVLYVVLNKVVKHQFVKTQDFFYFYLQVHVLYAPSQKHTILIITVYSLYNILTGVLFLTGNKYFNPASAPRLV